MDRRAWWATVHGVAELGHDRSDLAHTQTQCAFSSHKRHSGLICCFLVSWRLDIVGFFFFFPLSLLIGI